MRWVKLGKIFDPRAFRLPNKCVEFAQSPHALVFDNFVRIYFSTRSVDGNGKFLSHIAFVDMKKDFREVIRVSENPVISLGKRGCFDEHGIFPIHVIRHKRSIYGYTCGWSRRVAVSVETAIGLVISRDDGLTFERIGDGPVLAASPGEPFLVGDGFVVVVGGVFHMWYIFGTGWKVFSPSEPPERTYKIGHATSQDGFFWCKEDGRQVIPDRIGPDECQALPTVHEISGKHHMFFCYRYPTDFRKNPDRGYRIGHACSDDLANWTRDDASAPQFEATGNCWDSDMQCYPHVFECEGRLYMLYNGNEFGRYGFGVAVLQS